MRAYCNVYNHTVTWSLCSKHIVKSSKIKSRGKAIITTIQTKIMRLVIVAELPWAPVFTQFWKLSGLNSKRKHSTNLWPCDNPVWRDGVRRITDAGRSLPLGLSPCFVSQELGPIRVSAKFLDTHTDHARAWLPLSLRSEVFQGCNWSPPSIHQDILNRDKVSQKAQRTLLGFQQCI